MRYAIFYPLLAQFALVFALLLMAAYTRYAAVKSGVIRYQDTALDNTRWPDRCRIFANCYANQFEAPVLFYVLCILVFLSGVSDSVMIGLAWMFVATRLVHAAIFIRSNHVRKRGAAFGAGVLVLMAMTALLLFQLLTSAAA